MMKKSLALAAGLLMSVLSMVPVARAQQPYLGVGLGLFQLDPGANRKMTSGVIIQAGDDFFPYLGGELRFGGTDKASSRARVNWFAGAYAKPKFDVSQDLTLYGLLGVTTMHASYVSVTTNQNQSSTKADFSYGFGLEYWSGYQVTVNAEWMRYASHADNLTKDSNFHGLNVDAYSIMAQYHF